MLAPQYFYFLSRVTFSYFSSSNCIVFFIIVATGAKSELNLVLVMGAVGLSVLRTLKREIRKLISKKPKNLNEREIKVEEIQGKTIWEAKT